MAENRQVIIATLPDGPLDPANFKLRAGAVPECGEGEVLVRTTAFTIGAGQRAGLQGSASYAGAPVSGVVMGGTGVAVVEQSNVPEFRAGDTVVGQTGWQEFAALKARGLRKVEPGLDPALHLGLLGTNGLTAYFGLYDIGQPEAGQTVVVSAAAGSVGHLVGQLAKRQEGNKEVNRELLKAYGAGIPYSLIGVTSTLVHNYYKTAEVAPFVTAHLLGTDSYFDQKDPTWSGRPA